MIALATTGISLVALGVMLGAAGAADIPVVKAPETRPERLVMEWLLWRFKCWFCVGAI